MIKFQNLQQIIAKAGAGMLQFLEELSKYKFVSDTGKEPEPGVEVESVEAGEIRPKKELLELGTYILALIGHAHYSLCMRRRDLIKYNLAPDYRNTICLSNTSITKMLFGDEVEKTIDQISKSNKASNQATGARHGYRSNRYDSTRRNDRSSRSGSFRGAHTQFYRGANYSRDNRH